MAFASPASRSMAESGKLVMLAYTGDKRSPLLPSVPTVRESGIAHTSSGWPGFVALAGLPAAQRDKLLAALTTATNDPEVVDTFTKAGPEPRANPTGDAFAARVKQEHRRHQAARAPMLLDALPRSPNNKVVKGTLRERAAQG